jgi:ubiquinone/menaquinone biosynthesis C-methylase UbiE
MIKLPFWVFRGLYWYLDKLDKDHQLAFMNFGYAENGKLIDLDGKDEINRYPIQLYHHVAEMIDLSGKDVVEVGSGRGGGLSYVTRRFSPASSTGVDIEKSAIVFSNRMFGNERLKYIAGNAHSLPLADGLFDVVMNVESSHRYLSMHSFVREVYRILKPGGHFLFTDFRPAHQWPDTIGLLKETRFNILDEKDITGNVLEALEKDSARREKLVTKYAPKVLHNSILNFSGAKGTATYEHFLNRKFVYRSFVLQKGGIS